MTNKYHAKKTQVNGITFDSRAEAARYSQLRLLERTGEISDLELQVPFELAPAVKLDRHPRKKPALRYIADFTYQQDGKLVVEDVKGIETDVFRLKEHLMKTVHNIDIYITGKKW